MPAFSVIPLTRCMVKEGTDHCWKRLRPRGSRLLRVQRQLLYPLPRVYEMQKLSHKKEKKKSVRKKSARTLQSSQV